MYAWVSKPVLNVWGTPICTTEMILAILERRNSPIVKKHWEINQWISFPVAVNNPITSAKVVLRRAEDILPALNTSLLESIYMLQESFGNPLRNFKLVFFGEQSG